MELVKIEEGNKKYFNEDFIKGFETGTYIQYQQDIEEKTGKWVRIVFHTADGRERSEWHCSKCGQAMYQFKQKYCSDCGLRMIQ